MSYSASPGDGDRSAGKVALRDLRHRHARYEDYGGNSDPNEKLEYRMDLLTERYGGDSSSARDLGSILSGPNTGERDRFTHRHPRIMEPSAALNLETQPTMFRSISKSKLKKQPSKKKLSEVSQRQKTHHLDLTDVVAPVLLPYI